MPLLAHASPINLIPNGSFEQGNTGFLTDYALTSVNVADSEYAIRASSGGWNPYFIVNGDHTSGAGQMMLVNGALDGRVVWASTFAVEPHTVYVFTMWANNACCDPQTSTPRNPATIVVRFDHVFEVGIPVGAATGWQELRTEWRTDESGFLHLEARDVTRDFLGNDFALDDFALVAVPNPTTVGEPATLTLIGIGVGALLARRRGRPSRT